MIDWIGERFVGLFPEPETQSRRALHVTGVFVATASFVLLTTLLVAYESIFLGVNNIAALREGDVTPQDIRAPQTIAPYVSDVLTEQRQQEVRNAVDPIYYPPDPAISRQQSDFARQVLAYIDNVRADVYGTPQQKADDLRDIVDLGLDDANIDQIITMNDAAWQQINEQITSVLERVMQREIREANLEAVINQLPLQVSVRFTEEQAGLIVAVVRGLIRPNTILNAPATNEARETAAASVEVRRSFEQGQIVARAGEVIDAAAFEALDKLGLLEPSNRRFREIARAGLISMMVMIVTGLYLARFRPDLFHSSRFLTLLAAIFLLTLLGARLAGNYGQIYLYPFAVLALLYVALVGAEVAVIGTLGMAVLVGMMQNNSLEMTTIVGLGGLMASLTLRRPERLNGYFMPGLLVGVINIGVLLVFYAGDFSLAPESDLSSRLLYSFLSGVLSAAVALAAIYVITIIFNLTTGLKLVELSQPSQPLLQRLLREAPGTYQHSLQVANLSEQAANAIGANADLVRVAAMYHDVGKMENPAFFTENQVEGINPHDALNDPARSASIIISHVTDGDHIARQYRLPTRIRDFILEHHGTQVVHFYNLAVQQAGDDETVDVEAFMYPGPKPQSRETAIMMLADSCEAAVRSRKPSKKQDITETVQQIIDSKIQAGQLDDSGLTMGDIKQIRKVFVDILQGVFHPRISYAASARPVISDGKTETPRSSPRIEPVRVEALPAVLTPIPRADTDQVASVVIPSEPLSTNGQNHDVPSIKLLVNEALDDELPLPDVPPLPRATEIRRTAELDRLTLKKDAPEEQ